MMIEKTLPFVLYECDLALRPIPVCAAIARLMDENVTEWPTMCCTSRVMEQHPPMMTTFDFPMSFRAVQDLVGSMSSIHVAYPCLWSQEASIEYQTKGIHA
jgi:hypothetical protein